MAESLAGLGCGLAYFEPPRPTKTTIWGPGGKVIFIDLRLHTLPSQKHSSVKIYCKHVFFCLNDQQFFILICKNTDFLSP